VGARRHHLSGTAVTVSGTAETGEVLSGVATVIQVDEAIHARARELEASGIRGMDALHLACAEAAGVNYFSSCDDRFLRKARTIVGLGVTVVSLLELVEELAR